MVPSPQAAKNVAASSAIRRARAGRWEERARTIRIPLGSFDDRAKSKTFNVSTLFAAIRDRIATPVEHLGAAVRQVGALPGGHGVGDLLNEREVPVREGWSPAHDYVTSHYVGRDTLGIELKVS